MDTTRTELKNTPTHDNLRRGFLREAGNAHRYLYFARIAGIEGLPGPAKILNDLAESCLCNAHGHLDLLKRFGDPFTDLPMGASEHNLLAAVTSTAEEADEFYPDLVKKAQEDGCPDIAGWFATLTRTSRNHSERLDQALAEMHQGLATTKEKTA
ncbi:MAG: rubrerythrin family protein [Proteobacteria bacterium]|nr:rubrerythrin family protein [Pseudomonadota bacterium]MBU1686170.1 rubrerythrin family protein [Pseudomonadota bacterium]